MTVRASLHTENLHTTAPSAARNTSGAYLPVLSALRVKTIYYTESKGKMSAFRMGTPLLHKYCGVTYTQHFVPDVLDRIKEHEFDPSDIIVASFPKSGTTWVSTVVSLILSDGHVADTPFTFLEIKYNYQSAANFDRELAKPAPHYLYTHLQFKFLEECFKKSRPKVIYVIRNPLDQMVSFYHFIQMNKGLGQYTGTWTDFYTQLYKQDRLCFGDYFPHVSGWWDAREEHSDHVLYVKYEDMIKDPRSALLTIAAFLGKQLTDDEVIAEILEKSSFKSMKSNPKLNKDESSSMDNNIVPFMRKGAVGDWRNFFTADQEKEVRCLYEQELISRGLDMDFGLPPTDV